MNDMQHTVTVVTLTDTTRKRRFCFGTTLPDTTRFEIGNSRPASIYDPAPLTEREQAFVTTLQAVPGIATAHLRPTHASITIERGAHWDDVQPQIVGHFADFLGWPSDSYATVVVPELSQPAPVLVGTQRRGYIGEQLVSPGWRN